MTKRSLANLDWQLSGYSPKSWMMGRTLEMGIPCIPEIAPVPARVPGSVHCALRTAGVLPDWNRKLNAFKCEWVDHRDWIFSTEIPQSQLAGRRRVLRCLGLDGYGVVLFNRVQVGVFRNGYVPHVFDLSDVPLQENNCLEIVFNDLPRFNGTPHISSEIQDLKARFNYAWDWMPRNVQIGIWDDLVLELDEEDALSRVQISSSFDGANGTGSLTLRGAIDGELHVELPGVLSTCLTADELASGRKLDGLAVAPWQCNGRGDQPLYPLTLHVVRDGKKVEERNERIGFKQIRWVSCEPSPPAAPPWICELNGEKIFLVGVNWTPIRAYYADVTEADYRKRLEAYKDIGFNLLRVWGGAYLEKEIFYRLCDEMGFLVWQEFPLSSSGIDNEPSTEPAAIQAWGETARSYIRRRRHHVSLLIWCGGNELQTSTSGKPGIGLPLTADHPMLAHFRAICAEEDPQTRYLPTSSSGPTFTAAEEAFGKGIHWDVHGPWRMPGATEEEARRYWEADDALFRSEAGAPGCSSMSILNQFYPDCELLPVSEDNPYWRRTFWWIDEAGFEAAHGRPPSTIEEYVGWSQAHQAAALTMAVRASRKRFPGIGGLLLWMGHDAFPCLANTSILDFHGDPKPAALAIREALRRHAHPGETD